MYMTLAAVAVGILRQVIWITSLQEGFSDTICLAIPICLFMLVFVFLGLLVLTIRLRSPAPILVLIGGIFLAFQLPLLPRLPSREEHHFRDYRADYEAVVELARNDELLPSDECRDAFLVPESLAHVSAADCLQVFHWNPHGLVVYFHPLREFYDLVAYVEFDDDAPNPCFYESERYSEPYVVEKIDAHWYLCTYSWN